MDSGRKLKEVLRALVAGSKKGKLTTSLPEPGCPFGMVVEERLKNVERSLQENKTRVNTLIFLVLAAVLEQIVLRLLDR